MKLLNYFRDIDNNVKGWLGIKGHYLALDKQKHVVLGMLVFIFGAAYCYTFRNYSLRDSLINGFGWSLVVAVAKEVYDFIMLKLGKKENWQPVPGIIATTLLPFILTVLIINLI